jgi:2-haloacid dehalogenase/putative hydrolase of the HAD superfamily
MRDEKSWPRAIFLDFYGTVVAEDEVYIDRICSRIAEASPRQVEPKEIGSYWGRAFGEICLKSYGSAFQLQREVEQASLKEVLLHFDADLDSEELSQDLYDYWAHPTIFPESRDVLAGCDVNICLLSNIDNMELDSALRYNGLSFDLVITSEDCRAYKPRPEMFEKALSLLDLTCDDVLHVGDSLGSDVRGARALGIPVLWINRKKRELPNGFEPPDYVSPDLTGILDILNS